ncbi:MAG: sigma-54-dependent Fis family transcriptional regulator [Candidatus Aminicenantes bacterium]|nr:sigma-54-dependent Fis family transcriptional regulator [Candidatus Aminicenantes bacterium]
MGGFEMGLRNSIESRLLGKSQSIREIREKIQKVALCDLPVLITGETGVGKGLVAELIHKSGPRASKEFVHLNCSNLSSELFESELFGYEKGAFTGAVERKKGKLELVDGGTVFLDEIGDLHLHNQAKLLLFMDKGIFYRLGGTEELRADIRLIAATNKNLLDEINCGKFRLDLYYRIGVLNIHIPPLRERKEDIPLLVESILNRENDKLGVSKILLPEALDKLLAHHWPGNVRELENVLRRALVICDDNKITAEDIKFYGCTHPLSFESPDQSNNVVFQRYKEMVEGKKSFWEVVHKRFLQRELKREEVVAIIKMGLKEARTYRKLMELFNAGYTQRDYKRFMKMLARHGINPHFRGIKSP